LTSSFFGLVPFAFSRNATVALRVPVGGESGDLSFTTAKFRTPAASAATMATIKVMRINMGSYEIRDKLNIPAKPVNVAFRF